jgi:riboflavin synthase
MFTGIVTDIGELVAVTPRGDKLHRLRIASVYPAEGIADGASIACSGVCLTVVGKGSGNGRNWFEVDAAAETLAVTTVGRWRQGDRINLERALKIGDELGGHMVSGHVDGIAEITAREETGEAMKFTVRAPPSLSRFIAAKGSVALDGVSLTVNTVGDDIFSVLLIPHTLKVTTLGAWQKGSAINLEIDQMARYAARLMERP